MGNSLIEWIYDNKGEMSVPEFLDYLGINDNILYLYIQTGRVSSKAYHAAVNKILDKGYTFDKGNNYLTEYNREIVSNSMEHLYYDHRKCTSMVTKTLKDNLDKLNRIENICRIAIHIGMTDYSFASLLNKAKYQQTVAVNFEGLNSLLESCGEYNADILNRDLVLTEDTISNINNIIDNVDYNNSMRIVDEVCRFIEEKCNGSTSKAARKLMLSYQLTRFIYVKKVLPNPSVAKYVYDGLVHNNIYISDGIVEFTIKHAKIAQERLYKVIEEDSVSIHELSRTTNIALSYLYALKSGSRSINYRTFITIGNGLKELGRYDLAKLFSKEELK